MADSLKNLWIVLGLKNDQFNSEMDKTKKQLAAHTKEMQANLKSMHDTFIGLGTAATAMGAAITVPLGLSVKAAAEEEQAMLRLGNTLKNVGVNFDDVKDDLDKTIMSLERMSAVSHDKLYDAFNSLLNITGNYQESLKLLPVALDLAAGSGMDLAAASMLVGKVNEGNIGVLGRYGIVLEKGATQTEAIEAITKRFGGSAEAMGNSTSSAMTRIKLSTDTLMEAIGTNLLPIIKSVSDFISGVVDGITKWIDSHGELGTAITIAAGVMGGLLVVMGGLLLVTGTLLTTTNLHTISIIAHTVATVARTAAMLAWTVVGVLVSVVTGQMTMAQLLLNSAWLANPIGLVIAGLALLVAAGIAVYKNWDTLVNFFIQAWNTIKMAFAEAMKFIVNVVLLPYMLVIENSIGNIILAVGKLVGVFNKDLGASIENVGNYVKNLRGNLTELADGIGKQAAADKVTQGENYELAKSEKEAADKAKEMETGTKAATTGVTGVGAAAQVATTQIAAMTKGLDNHTASVSQNIKGMDNHTATIRYQGEAWKQTGLYISSYTTLLTQMMSQIPVAAENMEYLGAVAASVCEKQNMYNKALAESIKKNAELDAQLKRQANEAAGAEAGKNTNAQLVSNQVQAWMKPYIWNGKSNADLPILIKAIQDRLAGMNPDTTDPYEKAFGAALKMTLGQLQAMSVGYNAPGGNWGGWMANGISAIFNKPTILGVAERGGERVDITPMAKLGNSNSSGINIVVNNPLLLDQRSVDTLGDLLVGRLRLAGIRTGS